MGEPSLRIHSQRALRRHRLLGHRPCRGPGRPGAAAAAPGCRQRGARGGGWWVMGGEVVGKTEGLWGFMVVRGGESDVDC